jgi:hypothetical protein
VVVDAAEELGHEGDAEEVVGVGEEAHAGDHDGGEVVPLRLGGVERGEHLKVAGGHCRPRLNLPCPAMAAA